MDCSTVADGATRPKCPSIRHQLTLELQVAGRRYGKRRGQAWLEGRHDSQGRYTQAAQKWPLLRHAFCLISLRCVCEALAPV